MTTDPVPANAIPLRTTKPEQRLRPYREQLDELRSCLTAQGSLGLLLIDVSHLSRVEQDYGASAFGRVHAEATAILYALRGPEIRDDDIVAIDDRGGSAFLVFLSSRRGGTSLRVADLRSAATRIEETVNRKLSALTQRYLRRAQRIEVGYSIGVFNPLVMPERLLARMLDEAWESVQAKQVQRRLDERCQLLEVLANGQLTSVFQPIVHLETARVVGYEALVRGPSGTPLQSPARLFDLAGRCELAFELDRACRRQAFSAARELPAGAKLFVNVLPSAMYDPEFQGEGLISLLADLGLSPSRIVLEITEEYAIKNYALFSEALENFTRLGFAIAVDDIGAGYSGLEKIAHLNPRYLKFDMELIKNIDASFVRREISRALKGFAERMESTIIAEGIETEEERRTMVDLGIDCGQGYLLGRPGRSFAHGVPLRPTPLRAL